jgi:hypothetical protein
MRIKSTSIFSLLAILIWMGSVCIACPSVIVASAPASTDAMANHRRRSYHRCLLLPNGVSRALFIVRSRALLRKSKGFMQLHDVSIAGGSTGRKPDLRCVAAAAPDRVRL